MNDPDLARIEDQKENAYQASLDEGAEEEAQPANVYPLIGPGRPEKYLTRDGTRAVSVTTAEWKNNIEGLLIWANKGGLEGKALKELRTAANIGTIVHGLIAAELAWSDPPEIPDDLAEYVNKAFAAWSHWFNGMQAEVVAVELPLVSEKHCFGGTIDCVIRNKRTGKLELADWKSSSALYANNLVQVAGYGLLWNETQPEPITGGFHIVRISRDYGNFAHHYFDDLSLAEEQFLSFLDCYRREKTLAKMAK